MRTYDCNVLYCIIKHIINISHTHTILRLIKIFILFEIWDAPSKIHAENFMNQQCNKI